MLLSVVTLWQCCVITMSILSHNLMVCNIEIMLTTKLKKLLNSFFIKHSTEHSATCDSRKQLHYKTFTYILFSTPFLYPYTRLVNPRWNMNFLGHNSIINMSVLSHSLMTRCNVRLTMLTRLCLFWFNICARYAAAVIRMVSLWSLCCWSVSVS